VVVLSPFGAVGSVSPDEGGASNRVITLHAASATSAATINTMIVPTKIRRRFRRRKVLVLAIRNVNPLRFLRIYRVLF
jgi:hypothetical protein